MNTFVNFSASVQNAFDNDEKKYIGFSQLLKDTANGVFEAGVTKADADKIIREKFRDIIGVDENASAKEIRRAIQRNKQEIFEVIEDVVDDLLTTGWTNNEFFNDFVEVRNLALGDANSFVIKDRSVLTVGEFSGDHWDIDRQKLGEDEEFRVKTSWVGLAVYEEFERIVTGRADWARLVRAIYEAMDNYIMAMVFNAVMTAGSQIMPGSNQFYKTAALDTAAKEAFVTMIEDVQAVNRGAEVVIMGTKSSLSRLYDLYDVAWISEQDKLDRRNLGRVGIWEGTRIVEIPQVFAKNDLSTKMVPNMLLVMPVVDEKFVKLVYEGNAMIKEVEGGVLHDWTQEMKYLSKVGFATVIGRYFGVWNLI